MRIGYDKCSKINTISHQINIYQNLYYMYITMRSRLVYIITEDKIFIHEHFIDIFSVYEHLENFR